MPIEPVWAQAETLTIQVGATPPAPVQLVDHGENWRYRKGTNEPPLDWNFADDATLDGTWNTGPGGIGVADGDDGTVLPDMVRNTGAGVPGYLTVYIRRTFNIPSEVDSELHLRLTVDWDDGFVAYLDGVEVARSPNVPAVPHPFNQGVTPDHPAVVDGGQLGVFDLGPVGDRLPVGDHVLALQGINGDVGSSDLTLNADLYLVDQSGGTVLTGALFSLVTTDTVPLSGTNTIAGSTRVVVNGEEAAFNIASGIWTKSQSLAPGMNRLFVGALDSEGRVLNSLRQDIVYQASSTTVGGTLNTDTAWDPSMGVLRATSDVIVPAGVTLTADPGTLVLFSPGVSLRVRTNGVAQITGTEASPVFFLPADGTTPWGEVSAIGAGARLQLTYADLAAGQLRILADGTITAEDTVVREMYARQMLEGMNGEQLILRRCHLHDYAQAHIDFTPTLVEDCLIENITSDAMDFEGAPAEILVRRTTWRYGFGGNTDAIDLGNNLDLRVQDCLIHDFPDKGISIAVESDRTTVENCLIYNTGSGINIYNSVDAVFNHNTVANSGYGIRLYMRDAGDGAGHAVGTNNISWGNVTSLEVTNGATFVAAYSDLQVEGVYPGEGNINSDPLFTNPALGDYRLSPGSPAAEAASDGGDMGVRFPVGGMPSAPFDLGAHAISDSQVEVTWTEDADNETGILVERSIDGQSWGPAGFASPNATSFVDSELASNQAYLYRARCTNALTMSRPSNVAAARTQSPPVTETVVGGVLPGDTTWDPSMGTILVLSNVTLPSGAVLAISPGTIVKLTNDTAITTTGGTINVLGTEGNKVRLMEAGQGNWAEIRATGAGASITMLHADISGGRVRCTAGASGLLEDCHIHDSVASSMINTVDAAQFTMRRCHVSTYNETLFQRTLMLLEECLFENPAADAVDFDGPPPGSVIRQSTFRFGPTGNNTDAVDLGPSAPNPVPVGVLIDSCVMHDFSDKGVSIGEIGTANSQGIVVSNCLIYEVTRGVQVKDTTVATIHDCTIVDCDIGVHGFFKQAANPGGGILTNYNNILFANTDSILTNAPPNATVITVNYCDTFGADWPGLGNLNADPQFLNPADRDYRLAANSPCLGTGLNGETMGVQYPVGGTPAHPSQLEVSPAPAGQADLAWQDNSHNEAGFLIQFSSDALNWADAASAPKDATTGTVGGLASGQNYYFRVRGTNFIGHSLSSEVVSLSEDPNDVDGDGLPNDWESDNELDPNDPTDALADADDDGMSNQDEYGAGTDPQDSESKLGFKSIELVDPTLLRMRFEALANRTYKVLFTDALNSGQWQTLVDVPADPADRFFTVDDALGPFFNKRFYRLETP